MLDKSFGINLLHDKGSSVKSADYALTPLESDIGKKDALSLSPSCAVLCRGVELASTTMVRPLGIAARPLEI